MTEHGLRETLDRALLERKARVQEHIFSRPEIARFEPSHLREASLQYLRLGGKSLRPAILMFCCAAVGGDEERALPAAAAVEVYHTWTLIHDDVIDRDAKRRGQPTVHEQFRRRAESELGYTAGEAAHYGLSVAILAGDILQGWCTSLLGDLARQTGGDSELALLLTRALMLDTQVRLVGAEALDVQFEELPVDNLDEAAILDMLMGKTGALFEFCGRAGAMIGLGCLEPAHCQVEALASFTGLCGLAFQLQDDILGIIGDEQLLGKPVGSDIREGKKTLIIHHALHRADDRQRSIIVRALGNKAASPEESRLAVSVLEDLGSIRYAQEKATALVARAIDFLDDIPSSPYKDLLLGWARFMVDRSY